MFKSSKSTRAAKCKTQLRLVSSRIKLLRNKRETQVKHLRKDISELLRKKQDDNARTRVDHAIREQNMVEAYDLIQLYCDHLLPRVSGLASQKTCPTDLLESIASVIYAAPRIADLPELQELRSIFGDMYGKHFVVTIVELRPGCGVSQKIIEKLSTHPVNTQRKMDYMADVAKEFHVMWTPVDLAAAGQVKKPAPELTKKPESPKSTLQPQTPPPPQPTVSASKVADVDSDSTDDEYEPLPPPPPPPAPPVRPAAQATTTTSPPAAPATTTPSPAAPATTTTPPPAAPATPTTPSPIATPPKGQQFIPFVQAESESEVRKNPYSRYSSGNLNPYGQPSRLERSERPDPYAEYKKRFLSSSYSAVASAAVAAAESADFAAVAARAAAELARTSAEEFSKASSSSSSSLSKETPPTTRRPAAKVSVQSIEERVQSYLNAHASDGDASDWESPSPFHEPEVNPSRNLWSESRLLDEKKERVSNLSRRQSTGGIHSPVATPRPQYDEPTVRAEDGLFRAEEDWRPSTIGVHGKPVFDEQPTISTSRRHSAAPVYDSGGSDSRNTRTVKFDTDSDSEHAKSARYSRQVLDERSISSTSRRHSAAPGSGPARDSDSGNTRPVYNSAFDTDSDSGHANPARYSRQDSVALNLQTMHENLSSKFDALYKDDEEIDDRPRSGRRTGSSVVGQERPITSPSPSPSPSPDELSPESEPRRSALNLPPPRNTVHLNFQNQFHGAGVDYNEVPTTRKHKIAGASVRTRRT